MSAVKRGTRKFVRIIRNLFILAFVLVFLASATLNIALLGEHGIEIEDVFEVVIKINEIHRRQAYHLDSHGMNLDDIDAWWKEHAHDH